MNEERTFVVASEAGIAIRSIAEISDALSACFGTAGLLLTEAELAPAFFDLKSRFAGELMQKFVNYQMPLAIVVPNPAAYGNRFQELAYEHRSHGLVRFFPSQAEAEAWLQAEAAA
jgi:hypothetical protein